MDGGLTSQVFTSPLGFDMHDRLQDVGLTGPAHVYVLRNATVLPKSEEISPKTIPILRQTAYSLVNTMALMNLEYIYYYCKDNGLNFHLTYIPSDFRKPDEPYDPPYMKELFNLGYQRMTAGYSWENQIPDMHSDHTD